ncbi:hypothetical protein Tco_0322543 [Tanacetum coccineum]
MSEGAQYKGEAAGAWRGGRSAVQTYMGSRGARANGSGAAGARETEEERRDATRIKPLRTVWPRAGAGSTRGGWESAGSWDGGGALHVRGGGRGWEGGGEREMGAIGGRGGSIRGCAARSGCAKERSLDERENRRREGEGTRGGGRQRGGEAHDHRIVSWTGARRWGRVVVREAWGKRGGGRTTPAAGPRAGAGGRGRSGREGLGGYERSTYGRRVTKAGASVGVGTDEGRSGNEEGRKGRAGGGAGHGGGGSKGRSGVTGEAGGRGSKEREGRGKESLRGRVQGRGGWEGGPGQRTGRKGPRRPGCPGAYAEGARRTGTGAWGGNGPK